MAFSEAHPLTLPQKALNKQRHLRGGTTMLDLSRRLLLGSAAAAPLSGPLRAQTQPTIRIGVLSDMSGPYRDISGPNCVSAAR